MLLQKPIYDLYFGAGVAEPAHRQARFWRKVKRQGECRIWTGSCSEHGYGITTIQAAHGDIHSVRLYAHRVAWVLTHEREIPEGYVIDQTCENKACCSPDHLECVTQTVNVERYIQRQVRASTCKRGHPITVGGPCRECNRIRVANYLKSNPDKRKLYQYRHDLKRGKTGKTNRSHYTPQE